MKKWTLVLLIVAFGFLVGWDKQEGAASFEPDEITKDFIEENLNIGMTEAQVIDLIGEADAIGVDAMKALPNWRYDIGAPDDYENEIDKQLGEGIVDAIDIEAIMNGTVEMQLFIGWDDGKIRHVANSYLENGKLVTYHLLSDGTIKYD